MATHGSGRHVQVYADKMRKELDDIHMDYKDHRITKEQIEGKVFELINKVKEKLYKGEIKLHD
ncbi:hypothetical protein EDM53_05420 [Rickettsiales endosymbiont of Peranema trichophorum]|uniref:hypothetical protein n=1 Tax=Rickettsiales endosymbiont of Peranema trichophorum TaxID=2486577 RepID=UPI0010230437|nr:hypothetical protein [Rickettsiales endosymbiont of Peranema trichophorum]RZI45323.1 hypothetical protein EDM53_05420 [Rickettsiales endosymbiont of Peranema trichophorum]